jgi:hypothetical protein
MVLLPPHAGKRDYERAFEGLVFPTSLSAVMKAARDKGGLDREVHEVIGRLRDREYASLDDLFAAVRAVYLHGGVPQEQAPV